MSIMTLNYSGFLGTQMCSQNADNNMDTPTKRNGMVMLFDNWASKPIASAPNAYPESRQNRYIPTNVARDRGGEKSPTAAPRLGYNMAIPMPVSADSSIHNPTDDVNGKANTLTPQSVIPHTIKPFRPMRSDKGPVMSCSAPQVMP